MLEKKIIQTARWLMIGMKEGRYPYVALTIDVTCSALDQ